MVSKITQQNHADSNNTSHSILIARSLLRPLGILRIDKKHRTALPLLSRPPSIVKHSPSLTYILIVFHVRRTTKLILIIP